METKKTRLYWEKRLSGNMTPRQSSGVESRARELKKQGYQVKILRSWIGGTPTTKRANTHVGYPGGKQRFFNNAWFIEYWK